MKAKNTDLIDVAVMIGRRNRDNEPLTNSPVGLSDASPSENGSEPAPLGLDLPAAAALDIIDGPTWSQVANTKSPPWRALALLDIEASNGKLFQGSAFFIHPQVLVTAAHCLFVKGEQFGNAQGFIKSIAVNAAINGIVVPFLPRDGAKIRVAPEWLRAAGTGVPSHDYGLIFLRAADAHDYWLGVPASAVPSQSTATVTGYPFIKERSMWQEQGSVRIDDPFIDYTLDTENGESGGPVFIDLPDSRFRAIGIHTTGTPTGNGAVLITPAIVSRWEQWINETLPTVD